MDAEFYFPNDRAYASVPNAYYRFLAEADTIVALDSGSMAAEAAHTGKPVYGDLGTIHEYHLDHHVRLINARTTFQEKPLPKLDLPSDIMNGMLTMYSYFSSQRRDGPETWIKRENGRGTWGLEVGRRA